MMRRRTFRAHRRRGKKRKEKREEEENARFLSSGALSRDDDALSLFLSFFSLETFLCANERTKEKREARFLMKKRKRRRGNGFEADIGRLGFRVSTTD
jgi:hypothetical protein